MKDSMRHEPPHAPELGERDGLAYALFRPDAEPAVGIVVIHGAGSFKESHFDFARLARDYGIAAVCFDQRGHGDSRGAWGPSAVVDVLTMSELVGEHAPAVALRGSSMGGSCAIHAAALEHAHVAVVAICPAAGDFLARSIRARRHGFRVDEQAALPWLESLSLHDAAASLAPATALLLLHARGDEQVPYAISEELYAVADEPKRLLIVPGGDHRSIQHDAELQSLSIRFIADAARRQAD